MDLDAICRLKNAKFGAKTPFSKKFGVKFLALRPTCC